LIISNDARNELALADSVISAPTRTTRASRDPGHRPHHPAHRGVIRPDNITALRTDRAGVSATVLLVAGCGTGHRQAARVVRSRSKPPSACPSVTGFVKRADFLTGVACEPFPGKRTPGRVV